MNTTMAGAMAIVLVAGCASVRNTVPVQGPSAAVQQLAGYWYGEFVDEREQRWSLSFDMAPGDTVGHGDVVTWLPGVQPQQGSYPWPSEYDNVPVVIGISFMRVNGQELSGAIEPYYERWCDCKVLTRFRGVIDGNRMIGTFTKWSDSGTIVSEGEWSARREK